jgi:hypothetical protein
MRLISAVQNRSWCDNFGLPEAFGFVGWVASDSAGTPAFGCVCVFGIKLSMRPNPFVDYVGEEFRGLLGSRAAEDRRFECVADDGGQ